MSEDFNAAAVSLTALRAAPVSLVDKRYGAAHLPAPAVSGLVVAFRRLHVPDLCALSQPGVRFFRRRVKTRALIFLSGKDGILVTGHPFILAFNVPGDSCPHDPVRRTLAGFCQMRNTVFQNVTEFNG
ncbi:hypothetical protein EHW99_3706 (plasmid) [Erwinia amylovora]|uniref:Uncharacterized protein n=3 Tax=Erwinia amylovora TaxID=552 RepID=A0A831ET24_ERWAM|nr:hypothetical protein [Erwinia amylovora]EKV52075.1 hypothetical protein EaACW_pEA290029 [Erwinia amylovora ACW56400]CBA18940.1 hypothetical protein predicted by Glimmer/Critica [Erwinia amylovora CFBP1430]CBJ48194.1 hypothetical protein [Erwinia amylovora ATCC 49946]CCO80620.1 hypothetical protein BN432_pEA290029 [Erwinia amylovora Ea356]CCO84436.1 hypothetical protein BN433_pEA290029 [Erwinia amylovora Ea266]CCO88185.1 hypothetical protein BN434_pEA290028 [Erwinia amylovora CFBP 2585]CCO